MFVCLSRFCLFCLPPFPSWRYIYNDEVSVCLYVCHVFAYFAFPLPWLAPAVRTSITLAAWPRQQFKVYHNYDECRLSGCRWLTVKYWYILIRFAIVAVCLSVCHKIIISLRAEHRRRKARRGKFTCENCTLSTINLGPAGRRPAWA